MMEQQKTSNIFSPQELFSYSGAEDCRLQSVLDEKLYLSKPIVFNDVNELSLKYSSSGLLEINEKDLFRAFLTIYDKPFHELHDNYLLNEEIHTFMLRFFKTQLELTSEPILATTRDIMERIHQRLNGALIKCFIPLKNNSLMWAHYGNEFQGICVHYERKITILGNNKKFFRNIEYSDRKVQCSLVDVLFKSHELFYKLLLTKHTDWSYEREVRYCEFPGDEHMNQKKGKLVPIPSALKATGVTFGTHCAPDFIVKWATEILEHGLKCFYLHGFHNPIDLDSSYLINNGRRIREIWERNRNGMAHKIE
ncbi:DUF2971 domain-containing protein [Glaciecola sp. 1036]|uniref:DUF2971 domain-containing protein n=1 Tax=Alteromonadaceae TaxID=72275 RepID=UPI003CFFFD1F